MINLAYAETTEESIKVVAELNAWDAIWSASPVVQLTLLTLVIMSIYSWSIIILKRKVFKDLFENDKYFLDQFWSASSFDELSDQIEDFSSSPMARIFQSGFKELQKMANTKMSKNEDGGATGLIGIDNLSRSLRASIERELNEMESKLGFLATTGSTAPFIGLFGTVWGIMGAFQKIGATGAASLAVVAPGISEALIATAVGLAAAIPAVAAYNHYVNIIKKAELNFDTFSSDFLNIAKRNFFKSG